MSEKSTNKTTTTTKVPVEKEKEIFLSDFLDLQNLTRAEHSYYTKHYFAFAEETKTIAEWTKIVKFIH